MRNECLIGSPFIRFGVNHARASDLCDGIVLGTRLCVVTCVCFGLTNAYFSWNKFVGVRAATIYMFCVISLTRMLCFLFFLKRVLLLHSRHDLNHIISCLFSACCQDICVVSPHPAIVVFCVLERVAGSSFAHLESRLCVHS
jgi:hypothetical protein